MINSRAAVIAAATAAMLSSAAAVAQLLQPDAERRKQLQQQQQQHPTTALCNSSFAQIGPGCQQPNHELLTGVVAFFSILLLLLICCMVLPRPIQDRIQHAVCICRKARVFSYVDVGLYRTRHSMYRKEVYVRHVWGSGNRSNKRSSFAAVASRRVSMLPDARFRYKHSAPLICSTAACYEFGRRASTRPPLAVTPVAAAAPAATVAALGNCCNAAGNMNCCSAGGHVNCWAEATLADSPLACRSAMRFRSEPNIRFESNPALTVTPASPKHQRAHNQQQLQQQV